VNTRELITYALRELERIEEVYGPGWLVSKHVIWALRDELDDPEQDDTALLRQALEALEFESSGYCGGEQTEKALTALRERLGEKK